MQDILQLMLQRTTKVHQGQLGTAAIFLKIGLPRCSPSAKQSLLRPLLLAPFSGQATQMPMLMRMLTEIVANVEMPVDHIKRRKMLQFAGDWIEQKDAAYS